MVESPKKSGEVKSQFQRDGFFLAIEANDPSFKHDQVVELLKSLNALEVNDVEV